MMRAAVFIVSGMIACGPPEEGTPCTPGEVWLVEDSPVLGCTNAADGYSDCEGPEDDWYWSRSAMGFASWPTCGCDGMTHPREGEVGFPTAPWRWFGSCERPCEDVMWLGDGWTYSYASWELPVAPQCTDCTQAIVQDGECVHPDGFELPVRCCVCYDASLSESGACVVDGGLALPAWCCDCTGASLSEGGLCLVDGRRMVPRWCCE